MNNDKLISEVNKISGITEQLESIETEYESTIPAEFYRITSGVKNDDDLFQSLFSLTGKIKIKLANKTYRITKGVKFDGSSIVVEGNNSIIDCSGLTGIVFDITNNYNKFICNKVLCNMTITTGVTDPENAKMGTIGIRLQGVKNDDIFANDIVVGKTFKGLYINGFETGIYFGKRAWGNKFEDCQIRCNNTAIWVNQPEPDSDAGENNHFQHCIVAHNKLAYRASNWISDTSFHACSIDHNQDDIYITNGTVYFESCHLEHKTGQTKQGHHRYHVSSTVDVSTGQNAGSWKSEPAVAIFNKCWLLTIIPTHDSEKVPPQEESPFYTGSNIDKIKLTDCYINHLTYVPYNYLHEGQGIFETNGNTITKLRTWDIANQVLVEDVKFMTERANLATKYEDILKMTTVPIGGYYQKNLIRSRTRIGEDTKDISFEYAEGAVKVYKNGYTAHGVAFIVPLQKRNCFISVGLNVKSNAVIPKVRLAVNYITAYENEFVENNYTKTIFPVIRQLDETIIAGQKFDTVSSDYRTMRLQTKTRSNLNHNYAVVYVNFYESTSDGVGTYYLQNLEVNELA